MKTFTLLAIAAVAGLATPAFAWTSINARQANQFARIQQGVRNGALTQAEATRLRSQFYALNRLERRYRIGGLTTWERRDLDKRFDVLSRRIYVQKHDRQGR
jgi:hypothetical protein